MVHQHPGAAGVSPNAPLPQQRGGSSGSRGNASPAKQRQCIPCQAAPGPRRPPHTGTRCLHSCCSFPGCAGPAAPAGLGLERSAARAGGRPGGAPGQRRAEQPPGPGPAATIQAPARWRADVPGKASPGQALRLLSSAHSAAATAAFLPSPAASTINHRARLSLPTPGKFSTKKQKGGRGGSAPFAGKRWGAGK